MRTRPILLLVCLVFLGVTFTASAGSPWSILDYKAFREPGLSMQPAIGAGDIVYVDMSYFQSNAPEVGQVVLYKPEELNGPTAKRIVAIGPGTVQIKEGTLIVDGKVVDEPYLKPGGAATPYSRSWGPVRIATGCIMLLGDYRDHSMDSRTYDCSTTDDLLGLVKYVSPSVGDLSFHEVP